jgi:hypothetical protein
MSAFRPVSVLVIALATIFLSQPVSAAERFLSVIEDLPLMPGLEEISGSAIVFSKPQGRIVEVAAKGAITERTARSFYSRTLPRLGWQRVRPGHWWREGEQLILGLRFIAGELVVQFSLAPDDGRDRKK